LGDWNDQEAYAEHFVSGRLAAHFVGAPPCFLLLFRT
jgi:hypothetical protein